VFAWLIGTLFIFTDGQFFTQTLILMASAMASAAPWLP
jgi:hypothetical protein